MATRRQRFFAQPSGLPLFPAPRANPNRSVARRLARFELLEARQMLTVTIQASGATAVYQATGPNVPVDPGLTITSTDADLTSATVTIAPGTYFSDFLDEPVAGLAATMQENTITFFGTASVAEYQAQLDALEFGSWETAPGTRDISIVVADGTDISNTLAEQVDVVPNPNVPQPALAVYASGFPSNDIIGGPAVPLDSNILIDSTDANLTGATLTVPSSSAQGDTLNFINQNGITGTWASGTLTLSGTATVAQYQAALQSVTFADSSNNTAGFGQHISVVISDGLTSSTPADEYITTTFPAGTPTITVGPQSGNGAVFTLGSSPVVVEPGLTVTSSDGNANSATVSIAAGAYTVGDTLNFTNQNGITGSYSAGTLTLTGNATAAQYQTALQSITFSATAVGGGGRTIDFVVNDGLATSSPFPYSPAQQLISVLATPVPPVVTASGSGSSYSVGGPATAIGPVTVQSPQANPYGATITISPVTLQTGDTLNFTNQNGVTGFYSGGVLTFYGTATPAQYQAAINSVTFSTTSTNITTRSLTIVVTAANGSPSATESITITAPTPPPQQTPTAIVNTLHSFTATPLGGNSGGVTVVGSTVFGILSSRGSNGAIYSMNTDGSDFQILHSFTGTGGDGGEPDGSLTLVGSTLFGVTSGGGSANAGTIYSFNTDGTGYQVVHSFTDGNGPQAGLTLSGNTLYGILQTGGNWAGGEIFAIGTDGSDYHAVFSFGRSILNDIWPVSPLVVSGSTIYGETQLGGGQGNAGTIFSVSTSGTNFQQLYAFPDVGGFSANSLTLVGSKLYGTTTYGGTGGNGEAGTLFSLNTDGSDFATLHNFGGPQDGFQPVGGLTLVNGTLFGTTAGAGVSVTNGPWPEGTIFSINPDGSDYQVLYTGQQPSQGSFGFNSTLTASDGLLFGTTYGGGTAGDGTIFSASINLPGIAITPSGNVPFYGLGFSPPVAVDSALALTSLDGTITGATVAFYSGDTGDVLNFTNQNGITGSFSGRVLTLSGTATVAQYQAALQSVTFSTTSTGANLRWVMISATDGSAGSNTAEESIDVIGAPTLSGSSAASFTPGGPPVVIDPGFVLNSADGQITGVTFTLTSGQVQGGDTLGFANQNGITGSFSGGVLTLSGTATVAQYQTALRSITFTTGDNPGRHDISVVLTDGSVSSDPITESVFVQPSAAVVTAAGTGSRYTVGGPASAIGPVTIQSPDGNPYSATITISPDTFQQGDTLNFTSQNGITGYYNNDGVLTLNGTATAAQYQAAINSITFSTTSTNTTTRSLSIVVMAVSASNTATESISITGAAAPPSVTGATTPENIQTSGLVIKPGAGNSSVAYFQIYGITGGTLYQNNGTTPIANNSYITLAQGEAGLQFTPNSGSMVPGGFTVRQSMTSGASGLMGTTARAAVMVTPAGPSLTGSTTAENTQTSGLVIKPGTGDSSVAYFQIYGITGGTLYQSNGTTPIANNSYITLAQGEAGLKFTPNSGSMVPGGFTVRQSTTSGASGLMGSTARAAVTVTPAGPSVTEATTAENTQTASGLVIKPGAADSSVAYFQIYGITGGTLYQNNGTTPIANNSYITLAQGEAGLQFTPNAGSLVPGGFTVRQSTTSGASGLIGTTARAAVTITLAGPSVTGATTAENTQTASGLVIKPGAGDTSAAYFQIYGITGGTLYQNNGTTPIANNSYITLAQGEAGLKFTPNTGSLVPGGFTVRESTTSGASGLSGPTARAAISVLSASTAATTNPVSLALAVQETGSSLSTPTSTVTNVIPANNGSTSTTSAAGTASPSTGGSDTAGLNSTSSGSHGRHQLAANDEAVADFELTDLYV